MPRSLSPQMRQHLDGCLHRPSTFYRHLGHLPDQRRLLDSGRLNLRCFAENLEPISKMFKTHKIRYVVMSPMSLFDYLLGNYLSTKAFLR